jgi:uncharacterized repeat protein (TIGR03803 family)
MKKWGFLFSFLPVAAVAFAIFLNVVSASAKEVPIIQFTTTQGGIEPQNGLVADVKGDLYGVTRGGGNLGCNQGCGVVFKLSPGSGGTWVEKVIHDFKPVGDAFAPATQLIFDGKGNLFGAANGGGSAGNGAVFELTPGANGTWTEKVIYTFTNQDGSHPGAHLAFDQAGNLYGALYEGGFQGNGAVFQLVPQSNGTWKESLIYTFTGTNGDGQNPLGGVVIDSKGNVYGTTVSGGSSRYGIVYELSLNGGAWKESILYNFTGRAEGGFPRAPLSIDASGNLYGTTGAGGIDDQFGVVFELTQSGGKWAESVLYSFAGSNDGSAPSDVVFDAKGNLYGTTQGGGSGCNIPGCGIVYQLAPQGSGPWKETILHNFESAGDGSQSTAGVLVDNAGQRLFGTTEFGGSRDGYGTVFEVEH